MATDQKPCPKCREPIAEGAKKCKHCGADLRNWFVRHWILTGILSFVIFVGIVGGGASPPSEFSTGPSAGVAGDDENSNAKLELLSFKVYNEYGFVGIRGEVKNISDKPIENVTAVGSFYDSDKTFVKSSKALIDYNPILPGQTSPFQTMTTGNPKIDGGRVEFSTILGRTIVTKYLGK